MRPESGPMFWVDVDLFSALAPLRWLWAATDLQVFFSASAATSVGVKWSCCNSTGDPQRGHRTSFVVHHQHPLSEVDLAGATTVAGSGSRAASELTSGENLVVAVDRVPYRQYA